MDVATIVVFLLTAYSAYKGVTFAIQATRRPDSLELITKACIGLGVAVVGVVTIMMMYVQDGALDIPFVGKKQQRMGVNAATLTALGS